MHDRNGKPLAVGDKVLIPGVVATVGTPGKHCNLTVATDVPMDDRPYSITLNAGQCEKVEASAPGEALPDNPPDTTSAG